MAASPRHSNWLADLRAMTAKERPLHGWSFFLPANLRERADMRDRLEILGAGEVFSCLPPEQSGDLTQRDLDNLQHGWILACPDLIESLNHFEGSERIISTDFITDVERMGRALPTKWYTCPYLCEKRAKAAATKEQKRRKRPASTDAASRAGGSRKQRRRLSYSQNEDDILAKFVKENSAIPPGGNALWKSAEKMQLLPGRSWQSMRDRFLKRVRPGTDDSSSSSQRKNHISSALQSQSESPLAIVNSLHQFLREKVSSISVTNVECSEGKSNVRNSPKENQKHLQTAATLMFGVQQNARGDIQKFLALPPKVRTATLKRWASKKKTDGEWFAEPTLREQFEGRPWSVYEDLLLLKRGLDDFCRKKKSDLFDRHNIKIRIRFLNAMEIRTGEQYKTLTQNLRRAFKM